MARDGCHCYFSFWEILALLIPDTPKNENVTKIKKKKNHLEISSFNTSVPKIMIICYIAPEIWHIADIIVIFHFGLFLLFYSLSSPKNENLKIMKRNPEDNIILQKCTKNHDHMLYCSWDICCVTDVNVIFILGYFLPFYQSNSPKTQSFRKTNKKTKKNTWRYHFTHLYQKLWLMIRWCTVSEIWCATDRRIEKVTHRGEWPT